MLTSDCALIEVVSWLIEAGHDYAEFCTLATAQQTSAPLDPKLAVRAVSMGGRRSLSTRVTLAIAERERIPAVFWRRNSVKNINPAENSEMFRSS